MINRSILFPYIFIFVSACSSYSKHATDSAVIPLRQIAGGADGVGGGNTFDAVPAEASDVTEIIALLPQTLQQVFAIHENAAKGVFQSALHSPMAMDRTRLLPEVYKLLFPDTRKDVFMELKNVKFYPKTDGPCKDQLNDDKDASAFNDDPQEICISVSNIVEKVKSANVAMEVVALAAHEMAHRMSANEVLAQSLQEVVRRSMHGTSKTHLEQNIKDATLLLDTRKLDDLKERIQVSKNYKGIDPKLCVYLGMLEEMIEQAQYRVTNIQFAGGFSSLRAKGVRALIAASYQSSHAAGFCRESKFFTTIPVIAYGIKIWPNQIINIKDLGNYSIRIGDPNRKMMWGFKGNREELDFNYIQLSTTLNDIQENLVPVKDNESHHF